MPQNIVCLNITEEKQDIVFLDKNRFVKM